MNDELGVALEEQLRTSLRTVAAATAGSHYEIERRVRLTLRRRTRRRRVGAFGLAAITVSVVGGLLWQTSRDDGTEITTAAPSTESTRPVVPASTTPARMIISPANPTAGELIRVSFPSFPSNDFRGTSAYFTAQRQDGQSIAYLLSIARNPDGSDATSELIGTDPIFMPTDARLGSGPDVYRLPAGVTGSATLCITTYVVSGATAPPAAVRECVSFTIN